MPPELTDHSPQVFVFTVNFRGGAYVTSSIRGQRARSTSGPEFAAARLAHKLIPVMPVTVERVGSGEKWKAYAS